MLRKIIHRSLIKKIMLVTLFASFSLIPSITLSQEEDYIANYGRVRYLENNVTIVRGVDGLAEESTINAPIFPGDTVTTSRDGKAEFQLADSSIVRMNYATKLKFQALTDLGNRYELSTILKLYNGSIYVEAENMDDKDKNFQIDTPFASIYILTDGLYRINVNSEQKVEAFCYRGVAEVVGEYDSVLLRSGKMTFVTYKSNPADPRGFNSFYADSFDRWNDERDEYYYQTRRIDEHYNDVPYEVRHYYTELSYYGNWVHVPVYGYVWYPYHIYTGWRPYYNGYWNYGPYGYFWVSYEPWGWAPYHYGRWSWASGYGWVWIPGRVFCGAWVYWSYGPSYIGWCALDYWNRPAFINVNLYLGLYDFRTWNFIHYRDINVRNVRHAVLRENVVSNDLRGAVVARGSPRAKPHLLSRDEKLRHDVLTKARRDKTAHIKMNHRERIAKHQPSFKDMEKKKISREPSIRKTPITDRRHASDIKREKSIPEMKKGMPQHKKHARDQKLDHRSREKKPKDMKTYPRSVKDSSTRSKKEFRSKPYYESGDRAREPEVKSYSRRMTEEKLQRNNTTTYQRKSIKDSQRYKREHQTKYYEKPKQRSYERKSRYDSSQKWKKMLKNMSHPRKTHEINRKAPPRKSVMSKGTTKNKPRSTPSSTRKSRSSSGQSKSGGKKSRGR